jgi:site-specific recombinase XerD
MSTSQINRYLNHLAVNLNLAASSQNKALSAPLFFYRQVIGIEQNRIKSPVWAKKPKKIPTIFTRQEVQQPLSPLHGTKRLMANLLYDAGSELKNSWQLACLS